MYDFSPLNTEIRNINVKFNSAARKIVLQRSLGAAIRFSKQAGHVIGAQPFCLELPGVEFVSTANVQVLMGHYDFGNNQRSWLLRYNGGLDFLWSTDGTFQSGNSLTYAWPPTVDTPYDICVERDDLGELRIFVNGAVVASATVTATFWNSTADLVCGVDLNSGALNTNFADIRMSGGPRLLIGAHRYGGAYTPPAQPWPTS